MPGIKEGLAVLYQLDKKVGFVTNNSVTSREKYEKKFGDLGVKFDYERHLIHPALSMAAYLKSINLTTLIRPCSSLVVQCTSKSSRRTE